MSSAASGAVSGLAAGVTCGASVVATTAVIGTTSFAGNVVGRGISKGFNKIDYGEALLSSATDMLSFGAARTFGPAVYLFFIINKKKF